MSLGNRINAAKGMHLLYLGHQLLKKPNKTEEEERAAESFRKVRKLTFLAIFLVTAFLFTTMVLSLNYEENKYSVPNSYLGYVLEDGRIWYTEEYKHPRDVKEEEKLYTSMEELGLSMEKLQKREQSMVDIIHDGSGRLVKGSYIPKDGIGYIVLFIAFLISTGSLIAVAMYVKYGRVAQPWLKWYQENVGKL